MIGVNDEDHDKGFPHPSRLSHEEEDLPKSRSWIANSIGFSHKTAKGSAPIEVS